MATKHLTTPLYKKVLGTFFPPPVPSRCCGERGQPCAVAGAEPEDSTVAPCCAFKPPLPSKRGPPVGEEAGGRWLEAERRGEERARVSLISKNPDFPRTGQISYSTQPYHAFTRAKGKVAVPGWVPACGGKDPQVLLAREVGGCWFHLCRGSRRALQRRRCRSRRRTLALSPVRTHRLNATNCVWFVDEIKVTRH